MSQTNLASPMLACPVFAALVLMFLSSLAKAEVNENLIEDARVQWKANLGRLQNILVEYDYVTELTPPDFERPPISRGTQKIVRGRQEGRGTFRRLDSDRVVYEERLTDATVRRMVEAGNSPFRSTKTVYFGNVATIAYVAADGASSVTSIDGYPLPPTSKIDIGLGLRLPGENVWLDEGRIDTADITESNGVVKASINGAGGSVHEFTLDAANQWRMSQYVLRLDSRVLIELKCEGWNPQIAQGIVPTKITSRSFYQDAQGDQQVSRRVELTIVRAEPDVIQESDFVVQVLLDSPAAKNSGVEEPSRTVPENKPLTPRGEGSSNVEQNSASALRALNGVELEEVFNFGDISSGRKINHQFLIVNRRAEPIRIKRLVPDCGCTSVSPPSGVIEPGAGLRIPLTLDTSGLSGDVEKRVAIVFDGKVATRFASFRGRVESAEVSD